MNYFGINKKVKNVAECTPRDFDRSKLFSIEECRTYKRYVIEFGNRVPLSTFNRCIKLGIHEDEIWTIGYMSLRVLANDKQLEELIKLDNYINHYTEEIK